MNSWVFLAYGVFGGLLGGAVGSGLSIGYTLAIFATFVWVDTASAAGVRRRMRR